MLSSSSLYLSNENEKKLQYKDFRIGLYEAITQKQIKLKPCDIDTLLSDPYIIKKKVNGKQTSQSATIVILGKLNFEVYNRNLLNRIKNINKDVVLKISPGAGKDNSLYIEQEIYIKVINDLFLYNYTPNVILAIGAFTCKTDDVLENIKDHQKAISRSFLGSLMFKESKAEKYYLELKDEINDYLKRVEEEKKYFNGDRMNVLILERGDGISMADWYLRSPHTLESWESIFFQIFYTLSVFNLFGLKHNDLHDGNIFIQEIEPQYFFYITSPNTYFKVLVKYMVKIYDFDFGSMTGINTVQAKELGLNNLVLRNTHFQGALNSNFCITHGICNKPNPKFDTFKVLNNLYKFTVPNLKYYKRDEEAKYIKNFVEKNVSVELLKKMYNNTLCNLKKNDKDKDVCKGPYIPPDNLLRSPIEVVYDNFPSYKENIKNYPKAYLPNKYNHVYFLLPTIDRKKIFK